MPIQFLDMRLSEHSGFSGAGSTPEINVDNPLFIGDLGLQTLAIAGTPNASDVRVWLSGTITVFRPGETETLPPAMTVVITRNGNGTLASGTIIYSGSVQPGVFNLNVFPISVTAADFPPADAVNAGQIRYSLFIFSVALTGEGSLFLEGPVAFNGIAVAGSN